MDETNPSESAAASTEANPAPPSPVSGQVRGRVTPPQNSRSRWVAIVTGALSILIGLLYLLLVTVLDRSGPLLPPPPEAYGGIDPSPSSVPVPADRSPAPRV